MRGSERLQFALSTTVICEPGLVRLIAGEDFRFTLRGDALESWLPRIVEQLDGQRTVDAVLADLDPARRTEALTLFERLLGERLLFVADSLPAGFAASPHPEGSGRLFEQVQSLHSAQRDKPAARRVRVLCQDTLDYDRALHFNQACRAGQDPWLWATLGPSARAFVSPIFWPDCGPCIACLLDGFERLSPAPELYGALVAHGQRGGTFAPATFPESGVAVVGHLVHWKVALLAASELPPAVARLHVLEASTLELAAHRIPRDVECRVCASGLEASAR